MCALVACRTLPVVEVMTARNPFVVLMNAPNGRHSRRRGHRPLGAVSRPSDRPLLAGFGHGGHSLFIGGQPLVSHLDLDGEFSCDA